MRYKELVMSYKDIPEEELLRQGDKTFAVVNGELIQTVKTKAGQNRAFYVVKEEAE